MKYYSSHVGVHILIVCNIALFRHTFPTFKPLSMLSFSTSSSICGFASKKWKWNSYAVENERKTCWVRFSNFHYIWFCIYTRDKIDITFHKCIRLNVSFVSTLLRSKNISPTCFMRLLDVWINYRPSHYRFLISLVNARVLQICYLKLLPRRTPIIEWRWIN